MRRPCAGQIIAGDPEWRGKSWAIFTDSKGIYIFKASPEFWNRIPSHDGKQFSDTLPGGRRHVGDCQRFHLSGMPGRGETDRRKCGLLFSINLTEAEFN